MNIALTARAKERGISQSKILSYHEEDDYISCVLYEKRSKNGEVIEEVEPAIIFKNDIKHGDYELAVRLAEQAGLCMVFPEDRNFRTDYYGLQFMGHKTLVKAWGYVSNHLPGYRRWKWDEIEQAATSWMEDITRVAKIVQHIVNIIRTEEDTEKHLDCVQQYLLSEEEVKPFLVA